MKRYIQQKRELIHALRITKEKKRPKQSSTEKMAKPRKRSKGSCIKVNFNQRRKHKHKLTTFENFDHLPPGGTKYAY